MSADIEAAADATVPAPGPGVPDAGTIPDPRNDAALAPKVATRLVQGVNGEPEYFLSIIDDITRRKQAESRLRRLNRFYAVLSGINEAIVRTCDRQQLFERVCRIGVEEGMLSTAMIVEMDDSGGVRPVATQGATGAEPDSRRLTDDVGFLSDGTPGAALKTGHPDVCNDFDADPRMAPWREAAGHAGLRAAASFPIVLHERTIGALVLLAGEIDYFMDDEVGLMIAVAENISFALDSMQKGEEQRRAAEDLQHTQALFRMASRLARVGGWAVDLQNHTVEWSSEVRAIHEAPPGFVPTPEQALAFYAPGSAQLLQDSFNECARDGKTFDIELELITCTGRRVWARTIGEAERDHNGAIHRIRGALQDVSESRETAKRSHELAKRLSLTLESITDAFFTTDRDWRFTYVNAEAERMVKRPRADLLGKVLWDEFPEARGTLFHEEYQRALTEHTSAAFEAFYPPLDIWVEVRAYPSEQGLAVYFRDVTGQRRAREALRLGEERFRLLCKATSDAVWDWDIANDRTWWSEGFEHLFGFNRGGVEPGLQAWTRRIHPDDYQRVLDLAMQVMKDGESLTAEYRFRRQDGSYAYVLDRGYMIRNSAGQPVRMLGSITDLTQRRESEDMLRQQAKLIDEARDAIVVRDFEHQVIFWNEGAERLYGWTAAEASGLRLDSLLNLASDKLMAAQAVVLANGEWSGELEKTTRSEVKVIVESRWTLLRDAEGQPKSILTIETDITGRKQLEQQFLRAQRLDSIGTLAGGIAHDINNLLSPMLMGAGLLRTINPAPQSLRIIDQIENSANRCAELIKQVLSFARGVEGQRITLQLRLIVGEIESIIRNTFPKKIEFRSVLANDLYPVLGDPTQLNQVLLNLCVNARDAMPEGGHLTLSADNEILDEQSAAMHRGLCAGRYVVLTVSDTGCGISRENVERIFEPFFTTKELGKGTGLGLSTVLGIVRSHGGIVTISSTPGRGSDFKVYLPAETRLATADAIHAVADHLPRGNGELILLVDDEEDILSTTKQTLEVFGYRVLTAQDGAQAVNLYASHRSEISLVLTDMMMPVMDGAALMATLRRLDPACRVIAASGLYANADAAALESAVVADFIAKPYSTQVVLKLLKSVLARRA